jgi:hypothetical protein
MLKSHNGTSEKDSDPNSTLRGYERPSRTSSRPIKIDRGDLPARRLLRRRHGNGSERSTPTSELDGLLVVFGKKK